MAVAYKPPDEIDPVNQHWFLQLMGEINGVKVLMESVKSLIMPRADIEAADRARVLNETYQADMRGVNERITRLEAGPGRFIAWAGLGVASLGCLASLTIGGFSVLGIIFTIIWTLSHK